jgi:hypothetical protein
MPTAGVAFAAVDDDLDEVVWALPNPTNRAPVWRAALTEEEVDELIDCTPILTNRTPDWRAGLAARFVVSLGVAPRDVVDVVEDWVAAARTLAETVVLGAGRSTLSACPKP